MLGKRRKFDTVQFLIFRLIKNTIYFLACSAFSIAIAILIPWELPSGRFWTLMTAMTLGCIGSTGLGISIFWLLGGYRRSYYRKLIKLRRTARRRRRPCQLSIDLGLVELNEQLKNMPPSKFEARMAKYLAAAKEAKAKTERSGSGKLWESDELECGYTPPRPHSFLRRLLNRITRTLAH